MAVGDLQRVVGRNLRAYRQERGLSQEAFADQLGVHRTYMGGLERGERNITLQSLERLAEELGVDVVELIAVDMEYPLGASRVLSTVNFQVPAPMVWPLRSVQVE